MPEKRGKRDGWLIGTLTAHPEDSGQFPEPTWLLNIAPAPGDPKPS